MRARHTIVVQPRKAVKGSAGQDEFQNDGDPVSLRVNVHPLDVSEIQFWGDRARDMRRVFFYGKVWPGNIFSTITFQSDLWDQAEPAQHADLGIRTRHFEVLIRKR